MTDYQYVPKLPHYQFQLRRFEEHGSKKVWAHFDDMGTGKAKCGIDETAQAYEQKVVDAMFVLAPEQVKINWDRKEIPKHLPDRIARNVFVWDAKKASTKRHQQAAAYALRYREGLSIVLMSFSAFGTKAGKEFAKKFLSVRKAAYLIDESQNFRTAGTQRAKAVVASGGYAEFKRIYTGTPEGKTGPLGLYTQIRFLDENFWKRKGINDYQLFKSFFADWFVTTAGVPILKGFKNEHIMREWLKEISSRVLIEDVMPDLPPKTHSRLYFELPSEHRRVYSQLENELRADLLSGVQLEVELAIIKLRKLMQVCCGYIKDTAADKIHPINDELPRIDLSVEWAESSNTQSIIFCRQTHDIDLLCEALGSSAARFDGQIQGDERIASLESWEKGEKQHLVTNTKTGGTGLTLTQANRVLFNSVDVDYVEFVQAQRRVHRPGQHFPVNYTYLIAKDTCDEKIVDSLVACHNVVELIHGGKMLELL